MIENTLVIVWGPAASSVWEFLFEYLRGLQSVYIPPQVEQVRLSASQEVNSLTIQQLESLMDYEVG